MAPIAPGKYGRTSIANPVNSKDFITKKVSSIRPDERFFSKFFRQKDLRDRQVGGSKKTNGEGEENSDDEFNHVEIPTSGDPDDIYGNDPEEEAYAQQLAEDMMTEHAAQNGVAGPDDDEEPMFDWSDDDNEEEEEEEHLEAAEEDALLFQDTRDDDEDDDEEVGEVGWGEGQDNGKRGAKSGDVKSGTFANADEFADILESSGQSNVNKHHLAWEKRNDWRHTQGKSKKRRRVR